MSAHVIGPELTSLRSLGSPGVGLFLFFPQDKLRRRRAEQCFSYVSPEQRVPQEHPLPSLLVMTEKALREFHPWFNKL